MARIVTFECEQCGSEIIVTATGETMLSPIYCCNVEVTEISSVAKKSTKPAKAAVMKVTAKKVEKKAAKKTVKKVAAKKVIAKKVATPKKKASSAKATKTKK